jgi:hypothetical protein
VIIDLDSSDEAQRNEVLPHNEDEIQDVNTP